jgi:hypothetical protein
LLDKRFRERRNLSALVASPAETAAIPLTFAEWKQSDHLGGGPQS